MPKVKVALVLSLLGVGGVSAWIFQHPQTPQVNGISNGIASGPRQVESYDSLDNPIKGLPKVGRQTTVPPRVVSGVTVIGDAPSSAGSDVGSQLKTIPSVGRIASEARPGNSDGNRALLPSAVPVDLSSEGRTVAAAHDPDMLVPLEPRSVNSAAVPAHTVARPPATDDKLPTPAHSLPAAAPDLDGPTRTHRVVDGDTLAKIAVRQLGSADRALDIFQYNRDRLTNPAELPIGIELRLPPPSFTAGSNPGASPGVLIPLPRSR